MQGPQRVRDPLILLDEGDAETTLLRNDLQERFKLGVVVHEAHRAEPSSAALTSARVRREP